MMHRRLIAAFAALALAPIPSACAAPGQTAQVPAKLQWRITPRETADTKVQFELSYRTANSSSSWGRSIELADLQGLDRAVLDGKAGTVVHFRLVRDAGEFDCQGSVWHGSGTGECAFAPGRAFAAELGQHGYGTPDDVQLFHLAMADIGRAYVAEVARQGYARPDIAQLVEAGDHGIHLTYLTGMGSLGYRVGTLPALVRLRDHGVGPDYIKSVMDAGLGDLPPDTLVDMRDHGVSASYIGRLRELGYAKVGVDRLIELRDHGVSAAYVEALRTAGYGFSPAELVRLRDNGVTSEFVRRVGSESKLSADELIRLRNGG